MCVVCGGDREVGVVGREGPAYSSVICVCSVLGCLLATVVWSVRLYMASAGVLCAYVVRKVTTRHVGERACVRGKATVTTKGK